MSRPISRSGPVDATEVRSATFRLIRRGGYDPQQVDPFLEIIAQTLEGGPHGDARIDGSYVHGVRFTTVRRGGYLPSQVDAFLDRVIDTFDERNASAPPPPAETLPTTIAIEQSPPEPAPVPPVDDVIEDPAAASPEPEGIDLSNEADFERLRILHSSGVLSDKEFAVLGARVRRRIATEQARAGVGA